MDLGNNKFIVEGDHQGIQYRVAVNTTLRPDGKCVQSCSPEAIVDGFAIPMISWQVQNLSGVQGYIASQKAQIIVTTIKNNFYNQIYTAQSPPYPLEELDKYGNVLEGLFSSGCIVPKYNGRPLLKTGYNSGGCTPRYWHDSTSNSLPGGLDPDFVDNDIRKNFLTFVSNPGCKKDFVANYLLHLSSHPGEFEQTKFIKDLSCAGNITIEKGEFGNR